MIFLNKLPKDTLEENVLRMESRRGFHQIVYCNYHNLIINSYNSV